MLMDTSFPLIGGNFEELEVLKGGCECITTTIPSISIVARSMTSSN